MPISVVADAVTRSWTECGLFLLSGQALAAGAGNVHYLLPRLKLCPAWQKKRKREVSPHGLDATLGLSPFEALGSLGRISSAREQN